MSTVAELPILADRYTPCVRTIRVVGVDLTGVAMQAQVRLRGDTPGVPEVDLGTVTNGNAEGLRLLGVSVTDGVPTSTVELVINETTMEGLPYQGEIGDTTALAWDWQATFAGRKRRIAAGPFLISGDGVTGADNAPAARPVGYGMSSATAGGMRAGATLTFGDEVVEVRIDGVDLLQPLLGDALAARADAVAAAQQAQTLAGSIVPYGAVTNNGIVGGRTQLSASFAAPAFQDGGLLDLFIPGDVAGPTSLKTDQTGAGYLRILDENLAELTGTAFPAGSVVRLKLNQAGAVWVTVSETPGLDYIRGIGSDASGAKNTLESVYGLPLALPIAGDPNKLAFSSFPAPGNQTDFETVATVTNTGPTFIYANGPYLRIVRDGVGTDVEDGDIPAGSVMNLRRSDEGGGVAILNGLRPLVQGAVPPPLATRDRVLVEQPWGAITFPNGGHAQVAPVDVPLVVIGSSNGHPDYVAAGAVPADVLVSALNSYTPGGGIRFVVDNVATPGAPWTDAGRQLGTSAAFTQGRARLVASVFGMNEARSTFYHDYGGLPAQEKAVRDSVAYIRSMGAEPVLNTIFHCDPRDMSGLEPSYFADNAGRDMVYPAFKAHPVSPTLDMVPPSTGLATEPLDWTGGGVLRTGSARLWDVNRMFRRVAAELNCKLLDFEWLCFRACIETVPDLSDALDLFYARGNPLHPLKPLYDRVVTPILRQLARALVNGRDDIRVFRGTDA